MSGARTTTRIPAPGERRKRLPPKLEAVLARLCERLGPLTKTKAVKLPYLVDVVTRHALGRRITEGTHQTWDYGVVTREAYRFFTHGSGKPWFKIEPHHFSEGGVLISLDHGPPPPLDDDEREIVDHVSERYGQMDAGQLGALTKALNTDLDGSVWGSNHDAEVGEDAYARLADGWLTLYEALPRLDLTDERLWGEPIDDIDEYLKGALGA